MTKLERIREEQEEILAYSGLHRDDIFAGLQYKWLKLEREARAIIKGDTK